MRTMLQRALILVLTALAFSGSAIAQSTFDTCAAEGTAKRSDVRALNLRKNRDGAPTDAQINRAITFNVLLASDEHPTLFREGDGAEIEAYVADVKIGAVESCNCGRKDHWYRDTHIELTLDPMDASDKTKILVVEVTPRFRQLMKDRGIDWSQQGLRDAFLGRWVRIRGWVFYDAMHDDESAQSGSSRVWRGSAWELHPVTNITVIPRPPRTSQPAVPAAEPAGTSTRCTATTKSGKQCSRTTTDPSGRCWQHK
jgi:hypothetical protein